MNGPFFKRSVIATVVITLICGIFIFVKRLSVPQVIVPAAPAASVSQPAPSLESEETAQSGQAAPTPLPKELLPTKLFKSGRKQELSKEQKETQAKITKAFASEANARLALRDMADCVQRTENIEEFKKLFPLLKDAPPDRHLKRNLQISCVGLGVQLVAKFPGLAEQFQKQVLSHVEPEIRNFALSPEAKKLMSDSPVST